MRVTKKSSRCVIFFCAKLCKPALALPPKKITQHDISFFTLIDRKKKLHELTNFFTRLYHEKKNAPLYRKKNHNFQGFPLIQKRIFPNISESELNLLIPNIPNISEYETGEHSGFGGIRGGSPVLWGMYSGYGAHSFPPIF